MGERKRQHGTRAPTQSCLSSIWRCVCLSEHLCAVLTEGKICVLLYVQRCRKLTVRCKHLCVQICGGSSLEHVIETWRSSHLEWRLFYASMSDVLCNEINSRRCEQTSKEARGGDCKLEDREEMRKEHIRLLPRVSRCRSLLVHSHSQLSVEALQNMDLLFFCGLCWHQFLARNGMLK